MKTAVRRIVSVGILLILLFAMQRLVMPKYVDDVIEGGFTAEYYREENPHEVLMIGDCELYENFSPITMWKNYGITSYIRGSAQQLTWQSYYLLEDALKYETPDVVVFNVLELKYNEPQREEYNRMTLDGMRWSVSKVQAIRASMLPEEHFIDYVFPLLRYHSRVTGLTANDWKYYFKDKTRSSPLPTAFPWYQPLAVLIFDLRGLFPNAQPFRLRRSVLPLECFCHRLVTKHRLQQPGSHQETFPFQKPPPLASPLHR